ncbi:MAG: right-handed parallel beta-helix repeat-containing protein [Deltaproteobacteria bacterium]|nr:right-handed parallel beta-helix repeat-containing protein [Deltaproteobacteria bacterium]
MKTLRLALLAGALTGLIPMSAAAQDATTPGALTTPYPTLTNLSIEWAIAGDDNLNGVVTLRYRPTGTPAWKNSLPLRRIPAGSNEGFSWDNKHSGSVFNLATDTEYEIELTLTDPDGGSETRTTTVRTRPVPQASPTGTEKPVTPATLSQVAGSAVPGDILLLADGQYAGFTISQDGNQTEPIVVRAQTRGAAVVNGDVRADGHNYIYFEGLTVNGKIKFNNAIGITVRYCTINTPDDGIVSMGGGSTNAYIADNVVLGPTVWTDAALGASGDNLGEGIELTGPGNVIEHNYLKGFRDAISTLEDSGAVNQVSIDILNNDIEVGADDAIEADFTMGNSRVMRNRITNSFVGLSSQPSLGGPAYFIRNVMYNVVYAPFKLHRSSVGDVALHNTLIKCGDAFRVATSDTWSQAYFRNNLFIGGQGGGTYGGYSNGSGRVAQLEAADSTCQFDYDGYASIGTGTFEGRIGSDTFSSLLEMQANTTEANAVEVDMSIFAQAVAFLADGPFPERAIPDLRLAAGTAAIDKGQVLANINDNYSGAAPDLGAYELGDDLPIYGPRVTDNVAPQAPTGLTLIAK